MNAPDEFPDFKFSFEAEGTAAFLEKMTDASEFPFLGIECDPEEATRAGIFTEDALSEDEAIESAIEIA